jgi:2-phosphosulfolactate phosphatase
MSRNQQFKTAASDVNAPREFDPWPDHDVHVEWGVTGSVLAAARGDLVVVVDVLSFSTTVTIATARGFTCFVYSAQEIDGMGGIAAVADRLNARPMSKRRKAAPGEISLSPASVAAAPANQRLIVTSLNGAAVAAAAAAAPAVAVASLRNGTAAAEAIRTALVDGTAKRATVIACGEQWSSVTGQATGLRPGLEDWLGAGFVCRTLAGMGLTLSAEAAVAAAAWTGSESLRHCVSGRELAAAGFADDLELALDLDADSVVPLRVESAEGGRAFIGEPSCPRSTGDCAR